MINFFCHFLNLLYRVVLHLLTSKLMEKKRYIYFIIYVLFQRLRKNIRFSFILFVRISDSWHALFEYRFYISDLTQSIVALGKEDLSYLFFFGDFEYLENFGTCLLLQIQSRKYFREKITDFL